MPYRVLDLFCCAGGSAMGLHRAGFEVVGVDIVNQPEYPFTFIKADVFKIKGLQTHFDWVWASPPCQGYSRTRALHDKVHFDSIPPTRELLNRLKLPYILENVVDARKHLINPFQLCGSMFDLPIRRHRLFETNMPLHVQQRCKHKRGTYNITICGHDFNRTQGQHALGITHITRQWHLAQAIPPAYSYAIGNAVHKYLDRQAVKNFI